MDSFAFDVAETARLIRRDFDRRAAVLGTTRAQWRVLARLSIAKVGMRQIELAEALDVEPITLCRMIDRSGLVERRRDASDRRAWQIHLTEKAQPVIAQLQAVAAAFHEDALAGIDPEDQKRARGVLAAIRENLNRGAGTGRKTA
jgi:MarR family transcriptional regulator, transcriptional regulator for hemolysin